ncbi:MAG TPA: hypothetical protein VF914_07305 [Chloroflexia bacterium]|jgi:hypothetical protein
MNTLPDEVLQVTTDALINMRSSPTHHLAPFYRYQLYRTLGRVVGSASSSREGSDDGVSTVQAWLAILTAERVLPLFEGAIFALDDMDEDFLHLPRQLIDMARGLMMGQLDLESARWEAGEAHELFGNWLSESDYDPDAVPLNAVLAGNAAQRALSEAAGWDYFLLMSAENEQRWSQPPDLSTYPQKQALDLESQEPLTDEQLVYEGSDTAGKAAVAYACSTTSVRCEPERLEEFWTWWLTEALPEAWGLAASNTRK